VSGTSKHYFTHDGLSRMLSDSDGWFYSFMDSGAPYSLSVDTDKAQKELTLFINYRLGDGSGIAGLGMGIAQVSELIKNYRIGEHGFAFLADPQGLVKVHPDQNISSGTALADLYSADIGNTLLKKEGISIQSTADSIVAARYLPTLGWYVVSEIPKADVFGPLDALSFKLIVMNLIIAVLLMGIGLWLALQIAAPVVRASRMLDSIATGDADLTRVMPVESGDEVGRLASSFNHFIDKLRGIIQSVAHNSESVNQYANLLAEASCNTQNNTEQQQQSVDMIATAMHEMGSSVQEIARNAQETANAAQESMQQGQEGRNIVNKTVDGMNQIYSSLQDASAVIQNLANDVTGISSILEVIRGISEQTNLLALNAAIEAARAGEQGRGFAVVADEVRTLAQRTQESTEEINGMIHRLQSGAEDAVTAMQTGTDIAQSSVDTANQAGDALQAISDAITMISDLSLQVATATEEQSSVVDELNGHILTIKNMSDDNTAQISQISERCADLNSSANTLNEMVGNFRT